jgi:tripeptidyl-peptidase-1
MAVAPNVGTEFWSFAGLRNNSLPPSNSNQEPFLNWLLTIANTTFPPLVHSVSYDDDESALDRKYTDRCEIEFMKAGVRGISLLFAAGDDGIGRNCLSLLTTRTALIYQCSNKTMPVFCCCKEARE